MKQSASPLRQRPRQKRHKRKLELQLNMVAKLWDLSLIHKSNTWPRKRQGSTVLSDMLPLSPPPPPSHSAALPNNFPLLNSRLLCIFPASVFWLRHCYEFLCYTIFVANFSYFYLHTLQAAEGMLKLQISFLSCWYLHLHFLGYLQVVHAQQGSHLIRFSLFCFLLFLLFCQNLFTGAKLL